MFLVTALALGHPGAHDPSGRPTDFLGHRLELRLHGDTLDLAYVVEVPLRLVTAEALGADRAFAERHAAQLGDGLRVRWDGVALETGGVPVEEPGRLGDRGFVDFEVRRRATLPARTGVLTVSNGNYPDRDGFYATRVELDGSWVVTESSLARVEGGRLRDNTHGAWTREEASREVRVALAPSAPWERRAGPGVLPERMRGLDRLRAPAWPWALLATTVLAIGGLAWWRTRAT